MSWKINIIEKKKPFAMYSLDRVDRYTMGKNNKES